MSDQLAEAMVAAALAAVDFDPDEDAVETVRTALAAALRVLHDEGYHLVQGSRHLYLDYVAARVERPAEDGDR